jgi:hypothetical protein
VTRWEFLDGHIRREHLVIHLRLTTLLIHPAIHAAETLVIVIVRIVRPAALLAYR